MHLFKNIHNSLVSLIVFAVSLSVSACSDSGDDNPIFYDPQLVITTPVVNQQNGTQFVRVKAVGDWTISVAENNSDVVWFDLGQWSGSGDKSNLILTYDANPSDESRQVIFRMTADGKTVDATLTQYGQSGGNVNDGVPEWLELPHFEEDDNCRFVTHYTNINGVKVRNYSMYYDMEEKIAYWVAYPHHRSYIGNSGRTNLWAYDPQFSYAEQSNLSGGISGYDRGHQIPSGDRTYDRSTNAQTFYYTNMTPQLGRLNQDMWASLEGQVRGWMQASDTLYVVTGAVLKTVGGNETVKYVNDRSGNPMAVPNYYYKVLLYTKGSSYRAIGFWFEHRSYGEGNATISEAMTVREIEKKTGLNFFGNLPVEIQDDVETSFRASDWGL